MKWWEFQADYSARSVVLVDCMCCELEYAYAYVM